MSIITDKDAAQAFRDHFGGEPEFLVRAPGRVNLIGEHTDYNGGYVLPMTIDRAVWRAARARGDGQMKVYSRDYDTDCSVDLGVKLNPSNRNQDTWFEYIKGCAWVLSESEESGQGSGRPLSGLDAVLMGDVPQGAGLSSSAALEIASLLALCEVGGYQLPRITLAKLGQKAENQWVGMKCGIMDQTICALGQEGKALLIDCRDLQHELFDLPAATVVAILDTNTRHSHVASGYNERRNQCEEACRALGIPLLRDATQEMLYAARGTMSEVVFRRARHVISENLRVKAAAYSDNAETFGNLMDDSHASLRYDFEVSCPELDAIVEIARGHETCLGARMTGGGFGGSAVALLSMAAVGDFAEYVSRRYREATGKSPNVTVCRATDGGKIYRLRPKKL
jgi:galactokinase